MSIAQQIASLQKLPTLLDIYNTDVAGTYELEDDQSLTLAKIILK